MVLYHAKLLAYLLEEMRPTPVSDDSLLDHFLNTTRYVIEILGAGLLTRGALTRLSQNFSTPGGKGRTRVARVGFLPRSV